MQTFIMKIEEIFVPSDDDEQTTAVLREYEFNDNIDLSCWNDAKFWIYYEEDENVERMSESYLGFFVWLDKLPKDSYKLIERM